MQPFPANRPQNTQEIWQNLQVIEQSLPSSEATTEGYGTVVATNTWQVEVIRQEKDENTIVAKTSFNSHNSQITQKSSGLKLLVGGGVLLLGCVGLIYGIQANRNQISLSSSTAIVSQSTPSQSVKSQDELSTSPVNTTPQKTDKQISNSEIKQSTKIVTATRINQPTPQVSVVVVAPKAPTVSITKEPVNDSKPIPTVTVTVSPPPISVATPVPTPRCTIEVADPQDITLNVRSRQNR
ncbi:MAG: hypothetical protein HC903_29520 [Methylacidiphilales bacterium]|nr:hypothetical protein [Candidatus Methylacidiphilales bacterium]